MPPRPRSSRKPRSSKPRTRRTRKICIYCASGSEPDYKRHETLGRMVTERGKIVPRRITGTCARHQRRVATEVKRARHLAILPFVAENIR